MSEAQIEKILSGLSSKRPDGAWRQFLDSYAGKIMAIAWQYASAPGKAQDCFLYICGKLSERDFRRLLQYDAQRGVDFQIWLTTVVSRLCIDWRRTEYGRLRPPTVISRMSAFDQQVYRIRFEQHLDLIMCLHILQIDYPSGTSQGLADSLTRIHAELSPRQRWRLGRLWRGNHPVSMSKQAIGRIADTVVDPALSPDALVLQDEERENLRNALAKLTPEQQLLLRLRFQEGLSLKEVARMADLGDLHQARRHVEAALCQLAGLISGIRDDD